MHHEEGVDGAKRLGSHFLGQRVDNLLWETTGSLISSSLAGRPLRHRIEFSSSASAAA